MEQSASKKPVQSVGIERAPFRLWRWSPVREQWVSERECFSQVEVQIEAEAIKHRKYGCPVAVEKRA